MRIWGPGPVFVYEFLVGSRRAQAYVVRSLFVGVILLGLCATEHRFGPRVIVDPSLNELADLARVFCEVIVGTQMVILLVAAPAATAGSICVDKSRGTLAHVLVTDLSDSEIVLGKLFARILPILALAFCAFPVTAILVLLGGTEPWALMGSFLVSLGVALLGAAMGLTVSIWSRKTHHALLVSLALWGVCLLGYPVFTTFGGGTGAPTLVVNALLWINPIWQALGSWQSAGQVSLGSQVMFCLTCLIASVALMTLAVTRLRPVTIRQLNAVETARRPRIGKAIAYLRREIRWLVGPSLEMNPVAWREWHRRAPTRALIARRVYSAVLALLIVVAFSRYYFNPVDGLSLVSSGLSTIGLFILGVSVTSSLMEERARGSLDVLLATPLSTFSIVWGKWWAAYRGALPLVVTPFLIAHAPTWEHFFRWQAPWLVGGSVLMHAALATSLGLVLATCLKRADRAVTVFVVSYLIMVFGPLALATALYQRAADDGDGARMSMGSPFFAIFAPTVSAERYPSIPDDLWQSVLSGGVAFIVAGSAAAVALFVVALKSFDGRLGRVRITEPSRWRAVWRSRDWVNPRAVALLREEPR